MNGRLTRYCPHVPHVTGHAPDPSGYAHNPITFPRLQPLIEIPKALARSMTEAQWSEYVREHDKAQRREIANFYNLTSDPESLWGGTLVFLCRLHIMLGWFREAFETIWDVDMD